MQRDVVAQAFCRLARASDSHASGLPEKLVHTRQRERPYVARHPSGVLLVSEIVDEGGHIGPRQHERIVAPVPAMATQRLREDPD